jgi:hypothetical protein
MSIIYSSLQDSIAPMSVHSYLVFISSPGRSFSQPKIKSPCKASSSAYMELGRVYLPRPLGESVSHLKQYRLAKRPRLLTENRVQSFASHCWSLDHAGVFQDLTALLSAYEGHPHRPRHQYRCAVNQNTIHVLSTHLTPSFLIYI